MTDSREGMNYHDLGGGGSFWFAGCEHGVESALGIVVGLHERGGCLTCNFKP